MSISTPMMYPLPIYSAKDTAITQRPTSTALLCIDSEDRFRDYPDQRGNRTAITGGTQYSFAIRKNESLMNGFFTRIAVSEVVFPWVIPNINPKTNRVLVVYRLGAGPIAQTPITLTPGFYTPSQLASAIQVAVRALAPAAGDLGSFTMTYGTSTFPAFTYNTNVAGSNLSFEPLAYDNYTLGPLYYPYPSTTKQLFDVLGFSLSQNGALPATLEPRPGNIAYNSGLTYAQATRYFDIVCSQLTANQGVKDTMSQTIARDVLCRVYVADAQGQQSTTVASASTFCPPGCAPTTIYRDFAMPKQIAWTPNQPVPGYLQFDVYDDTGALLSESDPFKAGANNCPWSMTLLCSEN